MRWSIRTHLFALLMTILVPLIGLFAYLLIQDRQDQEGKVRDVTATLSQMIAANTHGLLSGSETLLQHLASRPLVRTLDPAHCDPLLADLTPLHPEYTNIFLYDLTGHLLCSGIPTNPNQVAAITGREWYQNVRRTHAFTVGEPVLGAVSHRWAVTLAYPVQDDTGAMVGILGVGIDLERFSIGLTGMPAPPGGTIAIVDRKGRFIADSNDSTHVGQTHTDFAIVRTILSRDRGNATESGIGGGGAVVYGFSTIPDADWHVFVGIPKTVAFATQWDAERRGSVYLGVFFLIAGVLAWWISRGIAQPLRALTTTVTAIADGKKNVRARLTGPREIRAVGAQFNRMVAIRQHAEEALRESEERYRLVLAALNEGVILQAADGVILAANTSAERILGQPHDSLIGRTSLDSRWGAVREDGTLFPADDHPAMVALRSGQPQTNVVMGILGAADARTWISINARPLFQPGEPEPDGVVMSFTDITERKHAEELLQHSALHDTLTGLANRALFLDRLTHTIDRAQRKQDFRYAVFYIDFDRFKQVNDSLGHQAGDELLVEAARRLEGCLRAVDTVSRLGGDEFAVLLDDVADLVGAERVAERIQRALTKPFTLAAQEMTLTVSIGIAAGAARYHQPDAVLRDADTALYRAKAEGRNCERVFDEEMHTEVIGQLQLERDLHRALAREEFRVVYQPIVSLVTGAPVGFEALARWHHPERGIVSPDTFIPVMEETGLILQLDDWLLRQACAQLVLWQCARADQPPLSISVNLSSRHFRNPHLAERVEEIVATSGIMPACLHLEITERVMLEPTDLAIHLLADLRALGVQIQVDDFGTGYSSLLYLHRFPFDALKLDREFLSGASAASTEVIGAVVRLARDLKLAVIAEGIEHEEQVARLRDMGCEYGQGYYFSRPMPPDETLRYVQESLRHRAPEYAQV